MRRRLIDPFRHARSRRGKFRRRIPIVAGRCDGFQVEGIAGAVIEQVELGVIGQPAPDRAAAGLPLVTLPGFQAGIGPDRHAEHGGLSE